MIEGLDGSGKSTQWALLQNRISDAVYVTFPDYDSHSGKIVQQYLHGELGESASNVYAASSFYAIDRFISLNTAWGAHLRDKNVICARYTSSNAIYQMAKRPPDEWEGYLAWLYDFEHDKLNTPRPDLTVYLDVPLALSQALLAMRSAERADKLDIHEADLTYRERCRNAAEFVCARDGWTRIDCTDAAGGLRSPQDINDELVKIVEKVIC